MEKKVICILLIALFLMPFSFAGIIDYSVPDQVPLNVGVTASGKSLADSNIPFSNQLCSFYFYDANTLVPLDRATDQYTDQTGRFFMPEFFLIEPKFKRGSFVTLKTVCGSNEKDSNFYIGQRESIAFTGQQEFNYITNQENTDTIFIWGVMILILITLIFAGISLKKYAGGK